MNRGRKNLKLGIVALVPPSFYAAVTDHGPPFMMSSLFGPNSNHSVIGLVILFVALILCPLAAMGLGLELWRSRRQLSGTLLILSGLVLLIASLTITQPYSDGWTLGPGAIPQP